MLGTCKLCLRDGVELRDSHFVPAGVYRILREESSKNPHPWLLTQSTSFQTSQQMTAPLLCDECEQRFSTYGENWVLRNCLRQNGSFRLASILESRTPDLTAPETTTKIHYAVNIPEIDLTALAYFAASIFWRGSVYPWSDGNYPVRLGPFEESFRKYLLGDAGFPPDAALWVLVRPKSALDRATHTPAGGKTEEFHFHNFPMPGLAFSLFVGRRIPARLRGTTCFVRGVGNPIIISEHVEESILQTAIKMLRRAAAKGR